MRPKIDLTLLGTSRCNAPDQGDITLCTFSQKWTDQTISGYGKIFYKSHATYCNKNQTMKLYTYLCNSTLCFPFLILQIWDKNLVTNIQTDTTNTEFQPKFPWRLLTKMYISITEEATGLTQPCYNSTLNDRQHAQPLLKTYQSFNMQVHANIIIEYSLHLGHAATQTYSCFIYNWMEA